MSVSFKKSTSKTNIKHNNRTMSEREKEKNSHIDNSRSDENIYLVQDNIKDLYEREFQQVLENYNEKQTRSDRKIDNYYEHIEASKKTATQQEMIIQVGEKEDFSSEENRDKANIVLQEWFQEFEERNPNLKVYNAVIHNDEASPHLHLNFVPVASDYKRGLEKQVAFDRAIKQHDPTLNKTRPFADWREKEVALVEKLLKERGIERKLVGTNKYKDVNEYKEKKDLEKEISALDETLTAKKNEILVLNQNINTELKVSGKKETKNVEVESEEKNIFGQPKKEMKKEYTGNVILSEEELKRLVSAARSSEKTIAITTRMFSTNFIEENKKLQSESDFVFKEWNKEIKENGVLKKEISELKSENKTLKAHISDLKLEITNIYITTKNFFKEHIKDLDAFNSVFKSFINIVKDKLPGSEFERVDERLKTKEATFNLDHVKDLDESLKGQKSTKKSKDIDMER